jgi:Dyp-type peroxidase family
VAQAKGILPRHGETDVMRDPRSCGYFIAATLQPTLDRAGVITWLTDLTRLVDELVTPAPRHPERRAAAVAVGLGRSFFVRDDGSPRFDGDLQIPAALQDGSLLPPLPGDRLPGDMLLYVISPYEAKANAFLSGAAAHPAVGAVELLRGYQRTDQTEPFGYRDGLRNIDPADRTRVVYVDADRHFEEPEGAVGGSYMAYLRILQNAQLFAALAPDQQDEIIGRRRNGSRLDRPDDGSDPRNEPADPPATAPTAHVAKVGPRGGHDDTQIFRRGLPFVDTTPDGRLEIGLNFCSFQASPLQLDVVLNDWALNSAFTAQPNDPRGGGVDALLDAARGITTLRQGGLYFVPPADPQRRHLGATLFEEPPSRRPPTTGRVAVIKRVVATTQPGARFERRGFVFRIIDANNQPVGDDFATDSTGRALSGALPMGQNYTLQEIGMPSIPNLQSAQPQTFTLDVPNKVLHVDNTVSQPGGYGQT